MYEKIKKMRNQVLGELEHIPKGLFPQGELRMCYWGMRMHSLSDKVSEKKTPREVLQEGISLLKKNYPNFEFKYDKKFFN